MGKYYPGKSLLINGSDLTSILGFVLQTIDTGQIPKRTLESYKKNRAHGEVLVSNFFDVREIVVKGAITGINQSSYEGVRDTIFGIVSQPNIILQTLVAGAQRYWTVTMMDTSKIPEAYGGYASVELHFQAFDPFGYGTTTISNNLGTLVSSGVVLTTTFIGTWNAAPIFTITVNSLTAASSQTMTFADYQRGLNVAITRVWLAGDVVAIDLYHNLVTVNGIVVPWSGVLPITDFAPGTVQLQYIDTFTARNVSIISSYQPRYI